MKANIKNRTSILDKRYKVYFLVNLIVYFYS